MDYLEYLGRRLVWLVVSLVVVIVAIVSDVAIGKNPLLYFSNDCLASSCHIFYFVLVYGSFFFPIMAFANPE